PPAPASSPSRSRYHETTTSRAGSTSPRAIVCAREDTSAAESSGSRPSRSRTMARCSAWPPSRSARARPGEPPGRAGGRYLRRRHALALEEPRELRVAKRLEPQLLAARAHGGEQQRGARDDEEQHRRTGRVLERLPGGVLAGGGA